MTKKTIAAKKPIARTAAKPAVVQSSATSVKKVSRKSAAGKSANQASTQKVFQVTARGFTVYTSPVRPAHRTREQIAAAIASLD